MYLKVKRIDANYEFVRLNKKSSSKIIMETIFDNLTYMNTHCKLRLSRVTIIYIYISYMYNMYNFKFGIEFMYL